MEMLDGLDDPSEWPAIVPELKKIDGLLRCSICFEYFNIAVSVSSCSHTYCSLCIRKHISQKKTCATCENELCDSGLRPNRVIDEIAANFKAVRKKLLNIIAYYNEGGIKGLQKKYKKTRANDKECDSQDSVFEESHKYRTPKRPNLLSNTIHEKSDANSTKITNQNLRQPTSTSVAGSVECPICAERVSTERINDHLDCCLLGGSRTKRKCSSGQIAPNSETASDTKRRKKALPEINQSKRCPASTAATRETANDLIETSSSQCVKRLPKSCFDAMSGKQLRQKAKSYDLSTKGSDNSIKKRLKEYELLYNSRCDSGKLFTSQEICQQVEDSENARKHEYKPRFVISTHDRRYTDKEKIDLAEKHDRMYNSQYERLVEQVKVRKKVDHNKNNDDGEPNDNQDDDDSDAPPVFGTNDDEEFVFRIIDVDVNSNEEVLKATTDVFPKVEPASPPLMFTTNVSIGDNEPMTSSMPNPRKTMVHDFVNVENAACSVKARNVIKNNDDDQQTQNNISGFQKSKNNAFVLRKRSANAKMRDIGTFFKQNRSKINIADSYQSVGRIEKDTKTVTLDQASLTATKKHSKRGKKTFQKPKSPVIEKNTSQTGSAQSMRLRNKGSGYSLDRGSNSSHDENGVCESDSTTSANEYALSNMIEIEQENDSCDETRGQDVHSPSLFDECDDQKSSDLSDEVSFLVDQAVHKDIRNQFLSSGSETNVDEDVVPRPPSNLDFTESVFDSQTF